MKISNFFTAVLSLLLMVILFPTCKDEVIPPGPDPVILEDVYTAIGVRVTLDRITIEKHYDGEGTDNSEFYGFLSVRAKYKAGYSFLEGSIEKQERALLWYRNFGDDSDYLRRHTNDIVQIGTYTDFFFNPDPAFHNDADIYFEGQVCEQDKDATYSWLDSDDDFIGTINEKILLEDIAIDTTIDIQLEEFTPTPFPPDPNILTFHISFEYIYLRPTGNYPPGYSGASEFANFDLRPEIPEVDTYEATVPATSERLIIAQKPLAKFCPEVSRVFPENGDVIQYNYCIRPKFVSGKELVANPTFNRTSELQPTMEDIGKAAILTGKENEDSFNPIGYGDAIFHAAPLDNLPRLQVVRYWKRIKVESIAAGMTSGVTINHSYGWKTEESKEISITLGLSSGIFSSEMTASYGITESDETRVDTSYTEEITAPESSDVIFAVWQLWDEYRIVDENGQLFADPVYEFKSSRTTIIPRGGGNNLRKKTYAFPIK